MGVVEEELDHLLDLSVRCGSCIDLLQMLGEAGNCSSGRVELQTAYTVTCIAKPRMFC